LNLREALENAEGSLEPENPTSNRLGGSAFTDVSTT
jgi:hypothetical protein